MTDQPFTQYPTRWPGVVTHYREYLDLPPDAPAITLLEGNTPLIPVPRLAEALGGGFAMYLKYEGLNPTGSFKDRGMTAAITQAVHAGSQAVICASTGNTAAAAAAYAARAGIRCIVIVPEGKIAMGKLAGSLAYGADVINIDGNFDDGLDLVREAVERMPLTLVNSINPYRLEGQKTGAFEIVDALGDAPDWLCLPVGNAGNISAYWMGFTQYHNVGQSTGTPRLLGAQAAGAAPIVNGGVVQHPETLATAIRIGNPARWQQAINALDESDGDILAVTDDEIMEGWSMAAKLAGVFIEPASAAGIAGLKKRIEEGEIKVKGQRVVCVVTGHGLKDPDAALRTASTPGTINASINALQDYLKL